MRVERPPRRRRSVGLTPLIDVVFLLLIFFMLASQLGAEELLSLELAGPASSASSEALQLRIASDGRLLLQEEEISLTDLRERLTASEFRTLPLLVVPAPSAKLQRITEVLDSLRQMGHTQAALLEPAP